MTLLSNVDKLLVEKILGSKVNELFLKNLNLTQNQLKQFWDYKQKIETGYPVDYVLGEIKIDHLQLRLNQSTLIVREETETILRTLKLIGLSISFDDFYKKIYLDPKLSSFASSNNFSSLRFLYQQFYPYLKIDQAQIVHTQSSTDKNKTINKAKNTEFYSLKKTTLLDVGTGSGLIALYLSKFFNKVYGSDISKKCVETSRLNAKINRIKNTKFCVANLLQNPQLIHNLQKKQKNDSLIIIANLPYVPTLDMLQKSDFKTKFEPGKAIYSGFNGLNLFKKMLEQIKQNKLKPKVILLELDPRNIQTAQKIVKKYNYTGKILKDASNQNRFLILKQIVKKMGY